MSSLAIFDPFASGVRSVACLVMQHGKDDCFVKELFESLARTNPYNAPNLSLLSDWKPHFKCELQALFWIARHEYDIFCHKRDGVKNIDMSFAIIRQIIALIKFSTIQHDAAIAIALAIIPIFVKYNGDYSRSAAEHSNEFGDLPSEMQKMFQGFWYGQKQDLVVTDLSQGIMPSVDESGKILGDVSQCKVSCINIGGDGLQLTLTQPNNATAITESTETEATPKPVAASTPADAFKPPATKQAPTNPIAKPDTVAKPPATKQAPTNPTTTNNKYSGAKPNSKAKKSQKSTKKKAKKVSISSDDGNQEPTSSRRRISNVKSYRSDYNDDGFEIDENGKVIVEERVEYKKMLGKRGKKASTKKNKKVMKMESNYMPSSDGESVKTLSDFDTDSDY